MNVGAAGHYLRDVEMATLLKRMTDKGLIVTVIFDRTDFWIAISISEVGRFAIEQIQAIQAQQL